MTSTTRAHLVHVPARLASSARRLTLHLPVRWRWHHAFIELFHADHGPPPR
ncbi:hypothetical protein ACO0M4_16720 [Streptomyces sp. RGM 3693]|uniref:hypothetical protein n=1 Tax=Streptomyces sp. RGM 3693 TaxID=3413284 RepID=UPI003D2BDF49